MEGGFFLLDILEEREKCWTFNDLSFQLAVGQIPNPQG